MAKTIAYHHLNM